MTTRTLSILALGTALFMFSSVGAGAITEQVLQAGGASAILAKAAALDPSEGVAQFRGRDNQRYTFNCKAGTPPLPVWGTDLYTDDSSVCSAGVHAGVISQAFGGLVTVEMRPGAPSYTASESNGFETYTWGPWVGSFVVVVDGQSSAPVQTAQALAAFDSPAAVPATVLKPACVISVEPSADQNGGLSIIRWNATNADAVYINGSPVLASGTVTTTLTQDTTFVLSVSGESESAYCYVRAPALVPAV